MKTCEIYIIFGGRRQSSGGVSPLDPSGGGEGRNQARASPTALLRSRSAAVWASRGVMPLMRAVSAVRTRGRPKNLNLAWLAAAKMNAPSASRDNSEHDGMRVVVFFESRFSRIGPYLS